MKRINMTKEIKELAKRIHKAEHIFVNGKIDKDHKLEDYYYLLGSFVFTKLFDKIEESNTELYNLIIDLDKRFNEIKESLREVSKQQKYLWQTLEGDKLKKSPAQSPSKIKDDSKPEVQNA